MDELSEVVKGGLIRRAFALGIDLLVVEVLIQLFAVIAFPLSGGALVDSNSVSMSCASIARVPADLKLPADFRADSTSMCTKSLFGHPTARVLVMTQHEKGTGDRSLRYPVDNHDRVHQVFDLAGLQTLVLVLMRWLLVRGGLRSPGYRLTSVQVIPRDMDRSALNLRAIAARRYGAFVLPLLPGLAVMALSLVAGLIAGPLDAAALSVLAFFGGLPQTVAAFAVAEAIGRGHDAYYDLYASTTVARLFGGAVEVAPETATSRPSRWFAGAGAAKHTWHFALPWVSSALVLVLAVIFGAELTYSEHATGTFGVSKAAWVVFGGMSGELVWHVGQWYRLATSMFLHASAVHLIANAGVLLLAGAVLEGSLGRGWFLATFLVGGLFASLMSVWVNPETTLSVGASGAVTAVIAAGLVLSFRLADGTPRLWVRAFCLACLLAALQASGSFSWGTIDRADHLGGAVGGLLTSVLMLASWPAGARQPARQRLVVGVALAVCAALFVSVPLAGFGDPPVAAILVPPDRLPKTDQEWEAASADLVRRYPADPRTHLARAVAAGNDPRERERELSLTLKTQRRLTAADAFPKVEQNALLVLGKTRQKARDFTAARDLFTRALRTAAGDDQVIFVLRGETEQELGLFADAVLDLRRASNLDKPSADIDVELANALFGAGLLDEALTELDATLTQFPDHELALRQRGWIEFFDARQDDALRDLQRAARLKPQDAYAALWQDIVAVRLGRPNDFEQSRKAVDTKAWPAPVLRFYAGEGDASDLMAAAKDADPATENEHRCEASFYSGERSLMQHQPGEARPYFDDAARLCPKTFDEASAVKAELHGDAGFKIE